MKGAKIIYIGRIRNRDDFIRSIRLGMLEILMMAKDQDYHFWLAKDQQTGATLTYFRFDFL